MVHVQEEEVCDVCEWPHPARMGSFGTNLVAADEYISRFVCEDCGLYIPWINVHDYSIDAGSRSVPRCCLLCAEENQPKRVQIADLKLIHATVSRCNRALPVTFQFIEGLSTENFLRLACTLEPIKGPRHPLWHPNKEIALAYPDGSEPESAILPTCPTCAMLCDAHHGAHLYVPDKGRFSLHTSTEASP